MSRLMSVAFTEEAVVERRKTVTRRKGWQFLKPGDHLTLCRKVQGRKPDEPLVKLAEVEVVAVTRHPLWGLLVGADRHGEITREGFPGMDPEVFVKQFFIDAQDMDEQDEVTRIEWRYVCGSGFCECGGCVL